MATTLKELRMKYWHFIHKNHQFLNITLYYIITYIEMVSKASSKMSWKGIETTVSFSRMKSFQCEKGVYVWGVGRKGMSRGGITTLSGWTPLLEIPVNSSEVSFSLFLLGLRLIKKKKKTLGLQSVTCFKGVASCTQLLLLLGLSQPRCRTSE